MELTVVAHKALIHTAGGWHKNTWLGFFLHVLTNLSSASKNYMEQDKDRIPKNLNQTKDIFVFL